jgi:general secretion pathway protein K
LRPGNRPRGESGIALIAVLLLLVFVLTLVGGMFYRHQIHLQKVTRSLVGEQALLLLLSAESWAAKVLADDGRESAIDHLEEDWSRSLPPMPVEGGIVTGCLMDLQARYNLNNLAWYTNKSWDDEIAESAIGDVKSSHRSIVRNLLDISARDSSDARIAALVDWVDADAWLLTPDSAEDNEYLLHDPPYRAANHGLVELSELSLVQGFGPEDIISLSPYVSVLPQTTTINVNTARAVVLAALLPQVTPAVYEQIAAARPFENLPEFYTLLAAMLAEDRQRLEQSLPSNFIGVSSDYFTLLADVELAGVHMAYSSTLYRAGGQEVEVLQRTLNYIPSVAEETGERVSINSLCRQFGERPS